MNEIFNIELDERVAKALSEKGFTKLTEIQEKGIPKLLESTKNFFGQANTGTGKTAAFVIPSIQKIDEDSNDVQCVVLTPTRELGIQVESEFKSMAKYTNARSVCVYGGVSYDVQIREIKKKKAQAVIGTPGRIIDLLKRGVLDFSAVNTFILDEADEMLNMGFLEDVELILEGLRKDCQLIMFSATMPRRINSLLKNSFGEYDLVKVENKRDLSNAIEQLYVRSLVRNFPDVLERIVESSNDIYAIVFCRTKNETYKIGDLFSKRGIPGDVLNGDMGQKERERVVSRFKKKEIKILVCTDVAARGLDIDNLTHVINLGVPQNTESYIHRIGRTGRAGMKGIAITVVEPSQFRFIKNVENFTKSEIKKYKLPGAEELKKVTINRELEQIKPLLASMVEKGDDYRVDDSFSYFQENFADFDREDILKIMFKWQFNERIRRFNQLPDLEEAARPARPARRSSGSDRRSGGSSRRNYAAGRDGSDRKSRSGSASSSGQKRKSGNKGKSNSSGRVRNAGKSSSKSYSARA
jgi:ATP-dependent RNA helicase DeaD